MSTTIVSNDNLINLLSKYQIHLDGVLIDYEVLRNVFDEEHFIILMNHIYSLGATMIPYKLNYLSHTISLRFIISPWEK